MTTEVILASVLFLLVGAGIGFVIRNSQAKKEVAEREKKGDEIIDKAKEQAKDISYKARKEAKEIAQEEKREADRYAEKVKREANDNEKELNKKMAKFEAKVDEHDESVKKLKKKEEEG